jgi:hypothetical protein
MKGDLSRRTFDARKHYSGVLMQQGRVQLDADWNEQQAINSYRVETEARDVIGACGGPIGDAGFGIEVADEGSGDKVFIGAGRYYADGILCENEARVASDAQLDLPDTADILEQLNGDPDAPTTALVYLDVWRRHITALDDPLIRETALGGPDTATRAKTVWQVKFLAVDTPPPIDCDSELDAWDDLTTPTTSLMNARTQPVVDPEDDCKLPPQAGYTLLENQLYRVEIHRGNDPDDPAQPATFKWSRDNGTVVSAIEEFDGTKVTVRDIGKDEFLSFANGQWVEVVDDLTALHGQPGELVQIDDVDPATREITLKAAPTPIDPKFNPKLRRWDQSGPSPTADGVEITSDWIDLEGGIQVQFTGNELKTGEYWLIPARTATGEIEWPPFEVPNTSPEAQPPRGIEHHYCRLAILTKMATGWKADDCRELFPPLTGLEGQKPGRLKSCCTCTVGDGVVSLGDVTSIQDAINALPPEGGKVCVLPGEYTENVNIDSLKNITLCGCGDRSKIVSDDDTLPVIRVANSQNIRIEHLKVEAHETSVGILLEGDFGQVDLTSGNQAPSRDVALVDLSVSAAVRAGIEADGGQGITIQGCRVEMSDVPSDWPGIFVTGEDILVENNVITVRAGTQDASGALVVGAGRGGLQAGGASERMRVLDNLIQHGMGNGITLGSFREVKEKPGGGIISIVIRAWVVDAGDPCGPCLPGNTFVPNPVDTGDEVTRFESAGTIYDLVIQGNRILDMGLNGIGVAGYFDPNMNPELITVSNLAIVDNKIRGCLSRSLALIAAEMAESMGYGGIALANVEDCLIIRENIIEDNGTRDIAPTNGVYGQLIEGGDISSNRIVNNGAKTGQPSSAALSGQRGGISIANCLPPTVLLPTTLSPNFPNSVFRQNGVPALKVHDNTVSVPLGQALTVKALGPVSVQGNQFTSRGMVVRSTSPTFFASTVAIVNLGVSNEFGLQLLQFSAIKNGQLTQGTAPAVNNDAMTIGQPGFEAIQPGRIVANGNVMFCNNQCVLDLLEVEQSVSVSSIFIITLDDIGFHSNQCDCSLSADFVLAQAILFGPSVRASDNRFKETLLRAAWSLVSLGVVNTTTDNQSTHCLLVRGVSTGTWTGEVNEHNTVLAEAFPSYTEFCQALNRIIPPFG